MWTPELQLRASPGLCGVILLTHGAVLVVLGQWGGAWWWLAPMAVVSGMVYLLQDGVRCLPWSITRVWLAEGGWYWQRRDGRSAGPFQLHDASRVDTRFIRLSLKQRLWPCHLIITAGSVGPDVFRQLQVFLRWAPDKNQPFAT